MKLSDPFLFPFAAVYDGITRLRNHLYDIDWYTSVSFDRPVIAVGNLSVGGTGKTPMIEYLVRLLQERYRLGIVSRGYGRKTRGFRLAGPKDNAETLGDEPYQYYRHWGDSVKVAVGEARALAISELLLQHPEVEVILLDDAYQHRAVKADGYLLLSSWHKPFLRDKLLPLGRLREARKGVNRASAVIMTKCPPNLPEEKRMQIKQQVEAVADKALPVFFAGLSYQHAKPLNDKGTTLTEGSPVLLLSGLAQPEPLEAYVQTHYTLIGHKAFSDHHRFSKEEIIALADEARAAKASILTTEKDASRLLLKDLCPLWQDIPVYTLPVQHTLLQHEPAFQKLIIALIEDKLHASQAE